MKVLIMNCSPVRNGATAEIVHQIKNNAPDNYTIKDICIDDYTIQYCRGCKTCYKTAKCIINDGVTDILTEFSEAETIILVAPSYWADVPGQFKSFIDRCTPFCNTHEPHASIGTGKRGVSIVLRTGSNVSECNRLISSIEHFFGHMEIDAIGNLSLCETMNKEDVIHKSSLITSMCKKTIFTD